MNKQEVISAIKESKLVVILRGLSRIELGFVAESLFDAGVKCCEITFDAKGEIPDEETARNIALIAEKYKGKMCVGAGTVLTEKQVKLAKQSGAEFIVSPDVNDEVILRTVKEGLVSVPGALSPSECTRAHRAGADFVKLFPAGAMGLDYFKSIVMPLNHINFLAVAGVTRNNVSQYLSAGAIGVGISTGIVSKADVANRDWVAIREKARGFVEAVN